jgi:hypothetical protein
MPELKTLLLPLLAWTALAAAPQETELDNLGKALVEKRSKVDALSTELDLRRNEFKERSRALNLQRVDLERQITVLSLDLEETERSLGKARQEVAAKEEAKASLKPLALAQVDRVQALLRRSLPFKTAERVGELDRLKEQLRKDEVKPDLALARLWSAVEDELRLCRETGLYRQSIELGGEPVLADVARLGMVLLYYKTFDEKVGMAVPAAEGRWTYVPIEDPDGRRRILALFDSLKKHVRQGYFEVPNPYVDANGRSTR